MSHAIYLVDRINPNDFPKHNNEFDGAKTINVKFGLRSFHNSLGNLNDRSFLFPTGTDFIKFYLYFFPVLPMNLKSSDYLHPNGKWKTKTFYDMYNEIKKDNVNFYFHNFKKYFTEFITGNKTSNFIKILLNKNDNIYFNMYPNKLRFSENCFKKRITVNNIIIPKQKEIKETAKVNFVQKLSFMDDYIFKDNSVYDYQTDMEAIKNNIGDSDLFVHSAFISKFLENKRGIFCFPKKDHRSVFVRRDVVFFMTKTLFNFAKQEFWSGHKEGLRVDSALDEDF